MIENTFQILDRIGTCTEENLWQNGIDSWRTFIDSESINGISDSKKNYFNRQLSKAKRALYNDESEFFVPILRSVETWRLFKHFRNETVYLDIETEGLGAHTDITVFGLYDGINTKTMIKGINMDYKLLKNELSKYKLIVTFNGSSFDLPYISKRYDILPNIPHIDLRHVCARLGLTGGLKTIEKELGIKRGKIVDKFYGGDALTLWRMYKSSGDKYYLKLLVEYNEEDIINLQKLAHYGYNRLAGEVRNKISS